MTGTVVAHGTQLTQLSAWVGVESASPEGTRWELVITCRSIRVPQLTIPGVYTLGGATLVTGDQIAEALAAVLTRVTPIAQHLTGVTPWQNTPLAQAVGNQVRVRWVKESAALTDIIAALAGIGTGIAAVVFADVGAIPAAALGALVALGVAAVMQVWQLVRYAVQHPGQVALGGLSLVLPVVIAAAAVVAVIEVWEGSA